MNNTHPRSLMGGPVTPICTLGFLAMAAALILSPVRNTSAQGEADILAPIRQSMALYDAALKEREILHGALRPQGVASGTLLRHSVTGYLFVEHFDHMTLLLKQQMALAMVHQSIVQEGGAPPHADFRDRTCGTLREWSAHLLRLAPDEGLLRGPARQQSRQSDAAIDRAAAVAGHIHTYAQAEVNRIAANQGAGAQWQFQARSPNGRQMRLFYDQVYAHAPKASFTDGGKRTIGEVAVLAPACFVLHQKVLQLTDSVYGVMAMEEHLAALSPNAPFRDRHQKDLDASYQMLLADIGWLDGTWQATKNEASTFGAASVTIVEDFQRTTEKIAEFCRSKGYAIDAAGNFTTSANPPGGATVEPSKPVTSLKGPVTGATFSIVPSGEGVLATDSDGQAVWQRRASVTPVTGLVLDGDERLLIFPSREVFDARTGKLVEILPATAAAELGEAFITDGDWKFYLASIRLYDTGEDAGERNNIAAEHPEVVARLQARARQRVN